MAIKPNYRMERANRSRNKERKKQDKLRRREEDAAERKALRAGQSGVVPEAVNDSIPSAATGSDPGKN